MRARIYGARTLREVEDREPDHRLVEPAMPAPARRRTALGLTLLTLAAAGSCARNPVTGRSELSLISEQQEIQMGQQGAQEVAQSIGLVADDALQQYLQQLGAKLAAGTERPGLPWTFRAVDDPTPNAFALPGGYIFVTRGLLALMNSEAELATVLGHEIGHVTAKHSVSQMSRAQIAQVGLGVGAVLVPGLEKLGGLASAGMQLLFLRYGRDDERQADDLGFRYALTQNYDVREMADVFQALLRASKETGQSPLPTWLATHPGEEERIAAVQQRVAAMNRPLTNLVSSRPTYLQRVNGLVYGENPRNGYFQGTTFIHPELRFRMDFPQGWQAQNTAQAVVGVSGQQDAAIQLTLAGQSDPATATRTFLSQQGIRAGQAFQESINGIPATGSYFQAQTDQGVIAGIVAYFSYGGRTYQVMTYAGASNFASYDPIFRRTIGSFAPVTDQRLLNVQPARVIVVQLPRAMTLAEINQQSPSSIPLAQLALLNGLDRPDSPIPSGDYVKRVAVP
jgi:predicted Zn-dependent protease